MATGLTRRGFLAGTSAVLAAGSLASGAAAADRPSALLRAEDFGARGDGGGDQSAALIRLRDAMIRDRERHHRVTFRPGVYRYTNNRWLMGVGSVTLEAEGCTFVNVSTDTADQNRRPFNTNSIFQDHGDRAWPEGLRYHAGFPIRTARAGDGTVRLAAAGDAGRFPVGARVLVHSFDQQWDGYPPNLRFFEWRRIAAVDAAAGAVTLDAPLAHDHDGAMRDTCQEAGLCFGRARLMLLERPRFFYPERIEIKGASFARNPNGRAGDANGLAIAAETLILEGCAHDGFVWPSENRLVRYEACRFGQVELDKLCHRVELRRCALDGPLVAGTGVDELLVEDCRITGYVALGPRRALLRGNRIWTRPGDRQDRWGAIQTYVDSWPVERLECLDNEIAHDGGLLWAINAGQPRRLTVAAAGPGNAILLADSAYNRDEVVRQLSAGARLLLRDGGAMGTLARIGWTGEMWRLEGDWNAVVAPGQAWEFCNVRSVRESGTRFVGGDRPALRELHPTQQRLGG